MLTPNTKTIHQTAPQRATLVHCCAILAGLLLCVCRAYGEQLFEATYTGKFAGFNITTTRTLEKISGDKYVLSSVAKSGFASIKEKSHFLSVANNFMPTGYDYQRNIFGVKAKKKVRFDWGEKKAYYTRDNKESSLREHDIELGILDPSLYQLKLQKDLATQNKTLKYSYVRSSKINVMEFGLHKETSISVNKKEYPALEYKRINDDDKKTFVTVIPELAYQIAKISVTDEDNKTYSTTIKAFSYDKQAMKEFYAQ